MASPNRTSQEPPWETEESSVIFDELEELLIDLLIVLGELEEESLKEDWLEEEDFEVSVPELSELEVIRLPLDVDIS